MTAVRTVTASMNTRKRKKKNNAINKIRLAKLFLHDFATAVQVQTASLLYIVTLPLDRLFAFV